MGRPEIRDQAHVHSSCDTGDHPGCYAKAMKERDSNAHFIGCSPVHRLYHGAAVIDQLLMA